MHRNRKDRFAKKMKRATTVTAILLLCLQAVAQNGMSQIGICMESINSQGFLKANVSHQISRHWSVDGCAWLRMAELGTLSKEEKAHEEEFMKEQQTSNSNEPQYGALFFKYWMTETYNGAYISAGARFSMKDRIDCIVEFGYIMKIYREISLLICYETCLGSEIKQNSGIGLGLCINF